MINVTLRVWRGLLNCGTRQYVIDTNDTDAAWRAALRAAIVHSGFSGAETVGSCPCYCGSLVWTVDGDPSRKDYNDAP